ncbi:MAG: aminomethyl-transferring glycine dehydrogenase subunit GcvPA [Oscillospiraceae bacterium]|nr:aminomethyl-transferring glycine dehydrogenase subunit GcvPA [Oscillospiraceae bacterium]
MGTYVPNTDAQKRSMLSAIGVGAVEDLFAAVPREMLVETLDLPEGLSELEVRRKVTAMAAKNKVYDTILRGAGAYRHFIPSVVKSITSREELVTAYTPYQAEISQGILQSIFEYQTMICALTGMEVSNASVYDGSTAAAEALGMCRDRKRNKAYVSATADPQAIEVMKTYCFGSGMELEVVPEKDGRTDLEALKSRLNAAHGADTACFYLQQPNCFGNIEDAKAIGEAVHAAGAKYIMGCNPIALAIMETPAACGADIAVGEAQPLGLDVAFGGPYLGYMAATKAMFRKLPGRIVGQTHDVDGNVGYVLTLTAREQHIRREKASSNICSNQALCAFTAGVYLTAMGAGGLKQAAKLSMSKAHYLAGELEKIGMPRVHSGEYFHEFVAKCGDPDKVLAALDENGILGGLPVKDGSFGDGILWCATELVSREEIDRAVAIIKEVC